MSTLKENVQKVVDANAAIKAAIAAKGVTVPAAAKLSDAAALIASIAGGVEFVDGAYVTVTCSLSSSSSSYAMYGDMAFCGDGGARTWSAYAGATKVTKSDYTYTADGTKLYTSPTIGGGASDSAVLPLTEAAQKAMVAAGVTSINIVCGSCLRPGTPVRMADGTERRIEDVRVGDLVLSVDPETGGLVPDRVVAAPRGVGRAWDEWTFSDGTVVGTVGRHRFWNADLGEFMYLEAWNEGEQALSFAGASDRFGPLLVSRVHHDEESEHHTLFTEKYNNYFAAGLLAGNRKSARGRWL